MRWRQSSGSSFTPDRGSQLLTNGDIEQGTTGWFTFGGSPSSVVQSPVHGGNNALLSSQRQYFWEGPAQSISITNGQTYQSSVWARLAAGSAPATVTVSAKLITSTNPDDVYFPLGSATVTADGWTQISGSAQINWTGSLSAAYWWVSTTYDSPLVDFVIDDATLQGPPVYRTVTANHVTSIDGRINGSLQQLVASDLTLNRRAQITRGLYVPGGPLMRPLNRAIASLELPVGGWTSPTTNVITLNAGTGNTFLISRSDPFTLTPVADPPAPTGTQDIVLNPGQSLTDTTTLRNLTLNNNVGDVTLPGEAYGAIRLNGNSTLILGSANATTPTVYNLQGLTVNSVATLKVLGPVVINVANGSTLNGTIGATANSSWLTINVAHGDVGLDDRATMAGILNAPASTVTIKGSLTGRITADTVNVQGSAIITDPAALQ